jgi:tetrahydromethanopterin S-methyltransferase subunit D
MSAIGAKPAAGSEVNTLASIVGIIITLILIGVIFAIAGASMAVALVGVIIGGILIGLGVHFMPVGGAPAAMGQAPGIATGVAMLAAGAGLAGLFGGAFAAESGLGIAVVIAAGAVGGGLMMAITCMMVNVIYVFGMGIPAASGKVKVDPLTGDTQPEFKSQGTEGHGLPFISYVGGVTGGLLGGAGGTLIYLELLQIYEAKLPALLNVPVADEVKVVAVSLAGIFAVGMFLVNAVLAAYNITGTTEGPADPKFKRFPRDIIASAAASAITGIVALLVVAV